MTLMLVRTEILVPSYGFIYHISLGSDTVVCFLPIVIEPIPIYSVNLCQVLEEHDKLNSHSSKHFYCIYYAHGSDHFTFVISFNTQNNTGRRVP